MTKEPNAASLVAEGFSRIADGVGVVLLALLGWRMFFVFDSALQTRALVVGLVGTLACWAHSHSRKNPPWALLGYVAIGLLSAAVHRWSTVSTSPESTWLSLFTPASHLAVMVVFVYGAAHILRTPERLSWFVVFMAAAISILAIQIAFDRAAAGFVYARGGVSLPSVPHWSGIHGASLALTVGLPLIAAMVVTRGAARMLAGVLVATGFLVVSYLNGSRGGLVSMAFVVAVIALLAVIARSRVRAKGLLMCGTVAILSLGAAAVMWSRRGSIENGENLSGRTLIWEATAKLTWDHPWLGVGPGNYAPAIAASGYAEDYLTRYGGLHNAHNLFLHSSAEVGILGAVSLTLFLLWGMRAGWRSWAGGSGQVPVVSLGIMFALLGVITHSASENFLDARPDLDRTRLLVWTMLAAAVAVHRLPVVGRNAGA